MLQINKCTYCGHDIVQGRESLRPMSGEDSEMLMSHYIETIVLLCTGTCKYCDVSANRAVMCDIANNHRRFSNDAQKTQLANKSYTGKLCKRT